MCGRFTITLSYEELQEYLKTNYKIDNFKTVFNVPRYNVAPGQEVISIINDGTNNRVGQLKWGFIPSFATDEKIAFSMINAKAETLDQKPAFKQAFEKRRCIILADSFYEWKRIGKDKTPMRILDQATKVMALAGIWNTYTRADGSKVHTCAIITTAANELVASLHDRMPVILDQVAQLKWLDIRSKAIDLKALLKPYPSSTMKIYQVSQIVNNAKNEVKECITPVE
jgi:putative SOS response-associated peptidase YedK